MVAIATITLSVLSAPNQEGAPSQVKNEIPSTEKIAVAEAKKPAEESLQVENSTPPIAPAPEPEPVTEAPRAISGSKYDWLAASGIPEDQWTYVDIIVTRESSWNPNAVNPNGGACGLGQQLPCGKWPGAWNDPVAALRAQYQYVTERYGGYAQAVAFWNINHWY